MVYYVLPPVVLAIAFYCLYRSRGRRLGLGPWGAWGAAGLGALLSVMLPYSAAWLGLAGGLALAGLVLVSGGLAVAWTERRYLDGGREMPVGGAEGDIGAEPTTREVVAPSTASGYETAVRNEGEREVAGIVAAEWSGFPDKGEGGGEEVADAVRAAARADSVPGDRQEFVAGAAAGSGPAVDTLGAVAAVECAPPVACPVERHDEGTAGADRFSDRSPAAVAVAGPAATLAGDGACPEVLTTAAEPTTTADGGRKMGLSPGNSGEKADPMGGDVVGTLLEESFRAMAAGEAWTALTGFRQALDRGLPPGLGVLVAGNVASLYRQLGDYREAACVLRRARLQYRAHLSPAQVKRLEAEITYLETLRWLLERQGLAGMPVDRVPPALKKRAARAAHLLG